MNIQEVEVEKIRPYERNAKTHTGRQVEQIANSIRQFGFRQPIVLDKNGVIIIGHGRYQAAMQLKMKTVPCVRAEDLTEEQVAALRLADNKLNESDWDMDNLEKELAEIQDIDMAEFGLDLNDEWFQREEKDGKARQEGNEEYNDFLEKFETKKTTDDCYTPENVYDVVASWVAKEFGLNRKNFMRPFYPGGDYQNEKYGEGKVVVDNPPFSILAQILKWYEDHGVKYIDPAKCKSCRKCEPECPKGAIHAINFPLRKPKAEAPADAATKPAAPKGEVTKEVVTKVEVTKVEITKVESTKIETSKA